MILVGEPAAVESERDPGWPVHTRDGLRGEIPGGEDDQVRRAEVGVVHVGEDIAVVFGRAGRGGANTASPAVACWPKSCVSAVPCVSSCLSRALVNSSSAKSPVSGEIAWLTSPIIAL
jgi:hypothetical protein